MSETISSHTSNSASKIILDFANYDPNTGNNPDSNFELEEKSDFVSVDPEAIFAEVESQINSANNGELSFDLIMFNKNNSDLEQTAINRSHSSSNARFQNQENFKWLIPIERDNIVQDWQLIIEDTAKQLGFDTVVGERKNPAFTISELIRVADEQGVDITEDYRFTDLWKSRIFQDYVVDTFDADYSESLTKGTEMPDGKLVGRLLSEFGIQDKATKREMWSSWIDVHAYKEESREKLGMRAANRAYINLKAMINMEQILPGSVKKCRELFGIRHFSRYPIRTLINMASDNFGKDPIFVLTSTADWNGALTSIEQSIKHGFDDDQTFIYFEAGNKTEFARHILNISRSLHGPIGTILINAHGETDRILFGNGREERGVLTLKDISSSRSIGRLKERGIFSKRAKIIVSACSTGVKGGIAEQIADRSGLTVYAPEIAVSGIKGRSRFGGIVFRTPKEMDVIDGNQDGETKARKF
jgi:hypothetical protein